MLEPGATSAGAQRAMTQVPPPAHPETAQHFSTDGSPKKSKVWPRPNFGALASKGHHPVNLRVLRLAYDSMSSKPQAAFRDAGVRYREAVAAIRDAALRWLGGCDRARSPYPSADLFASALHTIYVMAFGQPSVSDPCYFTRRHTVDQIGCQLYALLGDKSPFRLVSSAAKLNRISFEVALGWPAPRPRWERRGVFVLARKAVAIENRGTATFARWPHSRARDRGVFHSFDDHADAIDWYSSIGEHVVLTDTPATRLISTHPTLDEAQAAAQVAASV